MSTFFKICGIGVVINFIVLLKDVLEGNTEFTGWLIFDIPLSIFAPILGTFQFALPIGIGVAIVCGIICLMKSQD